MTQKIEISAANREQEAIDYLKNAAIGMAASNRTLYKSLAAEINVILPAHTALTERVAKLEAALRGLLPLLDWDVPEDSDDGKAIAAARSALAKP